MRLPDSLAVDSFRLARAWTAAFVVAFATLAPSAAVAQGFGPAEAEQHITSLEGTRVKVFASEPEVRQAIFVKCDDRGRLWTIQYLQYPNPAGLKRVKVDRWSRTVYDRVPEPPPHGPRGADRITIFADEDGDGRADSSKDFVDGLNLATGVEFGHGGVYVLQVPYLLFYPDRDRDDVPDGDPEVLLTGFGMEDAQSMVNHLTWGPDGWLYGVNGSTTTCNIRGLEFQQGCWRYHPITKEFELFCEGGLNCYGLTFDANGQLFYSTNGGPFVHAVQGGYFYKGFGKHGPLHNLFAYHYFPQQACDQVPGGPPTGGTIYLEHALPQKLRGTFVAGNFLGHTASWWDLTPRGSTFDAKYGGVLFDAHDAWAGPTDFCVGPDGCAYVSDFFDQRTAHPDPDANWDRSNGRIYRIEPAAGVAPVRCDVAALSGDELVSLLDGAGGWFASRARVELARRRDRSLVPRLTAQAKQTANPQLALESLWALNLTAGLADEVAVELLGHSSPHVRAWVVRLVGDAKQASPAAFARLQALADAEQDPVVLAQLAASAKRLPADQCLALVAALLDRQAGADDPRTPWLLWWALEAKSQESAASLIARFEQPAAWANAMWRDNALRLVRRYAAEGAAASYEHCHRLLALAPAEIEPAALDAARLGLAERANGLEEVAQGTLFTNLGQGESAAPKRAKREFEPLDGPLADRLVTAWRARRSDPVALELALWAQDRDAYEYLKQQIAATDASQLDRARCWELLRTFGREDVLPLLLHLLETPTSSAETPQVIEALGRFESQDATRALLGRYDALGAAERRLVRNVLLSRAESALVMLQRYDQHELPLDEVAIEELRPLAALGSGPVDALVRKHWGNVGPGSTEEKLASMRRFSNDLRAAAGEAHAGKAVFEKTCGICHQLRGEGAAVGPDLTTANRGDLTALLANIVDPSAVIRREFVVNSVVTTSGQVISGILAEQDAASVTLLTAENKRIKIARGEIEEMQESEISLMPEGLLEPLTPQQRRDLFAYLQQ